MRTRIKICCIASISEAKAAIELGADAIGLVAKMPSGPGPIPNKLIKQIAYLVPPFIGTFLLTSEISADKIIKHHQKTQTNTIQIVDLLSKGTYFQIKETLPSVKIVQVIHVIDSTSVEMAIKISESVDALLLDSGNPNLRIKELGGTGRTHNWTLSKQIRLNSKCPIILAGGLKPENVRQAIEEVRPFAVDVCSGVRTNGHMDMKKLGDFIKNVCSV
jgi:phosphoribosylanthranilate isomerase